MKIKAVLFDLDGTVADSLPDLADGVNRILAENGYSINRASFLMNYSTGLVLVEVMMPSISRRAPMTSFLVSLLVSNPSLVKLRTTKR